MLQKINTDKHDYFRKVLSTYTRFSNSDLLRWKRNKHAFEMDMDRENCEQFRTQKALMTGRA